MKKQVLEYTDEQAARDAARIDAIEADAQLQSERLAEWMVEQHVVHYPLPLVCCECGSSDAILWTNTHDGVPTILCHSCWWK